jgi:peptidoglycan/LPS O-acetylase OafA/YrhL
MCLILDFIPDAYLFLTVPKRLPNAAHPARWASDVGLAVTTVAIVTTAFPTGAELDGVALAKTVGGTAIMLAVGLGS